MTSLVSTFGTGFNGDISSLPLFCGQELFHIFDVFDHDYLDSVIKQKGRPAAILSDHVLFRHENHSLGLEFFGLPLWAMRECRRWYAADFDQDQDLHADYVFNFVVNKKQCSRYIMIKLVEIGGYQSYQYTWSGLGRSFEMSTIIAEMNKLGTDHPAGCPTFRGDILSPIEVSARFIDKNLTTDTKDGEDLDTDYARVDYGGNKFTWDNFLKDLFSRSCVSLISETGNYDKLAVLTEKTLYAFFGLTFPIWIGNYGQAQAVENLGLDVFNDVIDHRYQWYPTMIERCYWAFEHNKKILSDLTFVNDLRHQHADRLLKNRQWLLEDGLSTYCQHQIAAAPNQYRQAMYSVMSKFDLTQTNMTQDS